MDQDLYNIQEGFGATDNVAKPTKSSIVSMFGLGVIGLDATEGARVSGASRIIGVDLHSLILSSLKTFAFPYIFLPFLQLRSLVAPNSSTQKTERRSRPKHTSMQLRSLLETRNYLLTSNA